MRSGRSKRINRFGKPAKRVSKVRKNKTGSTTLFLLRRSWWVLRGTVAGILVLAGLYGGYLGVEKVMEVDSLSMKVIEVNGCRSVNPQSIRQLAGVAKGYPLLKVDLDRVRQNVISDPSIRDATVGRELPGILKISVVERIPAAVVLDRVFAVIDTEGVVMSVSDSYPKGYPIITGIKGGLEPGRKVPEALRAMETIKKLSASRLLGKEKISELHMDGESVEVYLTGGGTVLVLGVGDKGAQVGKLARLMDAGVLDLHSAGYDLRFQGRVIGLPDRKGYAGG